MYLALLQQLAPDSLTGPALEKHIIRHNHGSAPINLEQRLDMLHKVQLLVAGAGPEVVSHNHTGLTLLVPLLVDKSDTALAPKRRIGQHDIEILARVTAQTIGHSNRRLAIFVTADTVQKEVHYAQPCRVVHDLPAVQRVVFQKALLVPVKVVVMHNVIVRSQQEATRTTGRIADTLPSFRTRDINNGLDQRTRRKILACPALGVFSVLLQQPFVGITLHIGFQDGPGLAINQVNNQTAQLGRVLYLILRLTKDNTQHTWLLAQFL